ncbi:MAG: D-alanyl-D-alanine carboxypeptidase serine-type, family [Actinomycetia bacterium]|nr:D-alanyl-D-alanine carboxypeptidase serine-type, family [Actinomycetes bacterium]
MLVAGATCITVSVRSTIDASAAAAAPLTVGSRAGATPLFSPRRLPALFDDIVSAQQLQASVDFAFGRDNACIAIDSPIRPLARHAADQPLAPASTQKLLTGAAALEVLGPDHRFTTRAVTTANVSGGTLTGDLYLVGGGDPMLSTPAFEAARHADPLTSGEPVTRLGDLADAIVRSGVRHIDGAVIGDDNRHDRLRFLPVWKGVYRTDGDIGALSALGVDHGFVAPGSTAVPDDPAAATAQRLVELLAARGVTVGGGADSGQAPFLARRLAHVDSAPLGDIVAAMLSASDNWVAETLIREIGVAAARQGTTAAGATAVVETLAKLHIPVRGIRLLDGSGLAAGDRVTCSALLGADDLATKARFKALDRGLAVAGVSGTLATRLRGDPLQGVLRAKTGHIEGVSSLAGVIDDDEHLRFAFIVNGQFSTLQGQVLQDIAARLVAAYPQLPAGPVVPAPAS